MLSLAEPVQSFTADGITFSLQNLLDLLLVVVVVLVELP